MTTLLFPRSDVPGLGYDDGFCGSAAIAVGLHSLAAGREGSPTEEIFVAAEQHLSGSRIFGTVSVRVDIIEGEPRFRFSDGGPEASLQGAPTTPEEISRAVGHLTLLLARSGGMIFRRSAP